MFKEITKITNSYALVKFDTVINDDLINLNVVFEENNNKILGEIIEINYNEIKIIFLGEFINNKLYSNISKIPSIKANVRIINNNELAEITNYYDNKSMLLGFLPKYNNSPIKVSVNDMWNNSFALVGESNTGKTNASINIIKNLFSMVDYIPFNSIIFIINNNKDYYNTLSHISNNNINFNYKMYTTNKNEKENLFKIPLWLMDIEDYVNIFNITSDYQNFLIDKLLKYASIFAKNDETSNKYKNYLISKAILNVINSYSNEVVINKIRTILNSCNTEELNLNIKIPHNNQNLFELDNGKLEKQLIIDYISKFNHNINFSNSSSYFNINDLLTSINYILIEDELLDNNILYNEGLDLKNKLSLFSKSNIKDYFIYDNYVDINQYISNALLINNNKKAQIINFIMDDIDVESSKKLINVYLKIVLKFFNNLPDNKFIPIHIIFDDINDYISNNDIITKIINNNSNKKIFVDCITNNLNQKILNKYDNLFIFRNKNNILNVENHLFDRQKLLKNNTCIVVGKIIKYPMIIKFDLNEDNSTNDNNNIFDKWMIEWKK